MTMKSGNTADSCLTVLRRALHTAWWVMKIVVPISLVVTLLDFYGVIAAAAVFAEPFFSLLGLPGKAAVAYLSSLFLPLYVPYALMGSLALNLREVTVLGLMCLLAHNLPVEVAVQRRCGLPLWQSLPLRIGFSLFGGLLLNWVVPEGLSLQYPLVARSVAAPASVWDAMYGWVAGTGMLCLKLVLVITVLMFVQDFLKRHGLLEGISRLLAPFMKMCGLKPESSFIWLTANIVGLTYGAGIMAQEVAQADSDMAELRRVNRHVALNHSLLEDTAIFVMIGVEWYWLVLPRLMFALAAVWGGRLLAVVFSRSKASSAG